ncbi:MAG: PAS domain S-box protein [Anaerolineae bacterium]|nr:PAS domain S-box protein [Anaerolineae bacterium]
MNARPMDWTIWLRQQRHRAVRIQLGTILVLGLVGVVASLWRWWSGFGYTFTLPIYIIAYIVVVLLTILPSVRDEWRAYGFIVMLYGFGVFSLYSGWLAGGGRQFLLALTVVATVLATPRAGIITAIVSMVTYLAFALAFGQNWLVLRELPNPVSVSPIIVEGIGFTMTIIMTATSQWFFGKALRAANAANQEALQARTLLDERAQDLETANRLLSTSIASFHNIVERGIDGILIIDRQEVVRFANQAAGVFFARQPEQLIGSSSPFSIASAQNAALEISGKGASPQVAEVRVVETEWEGQSAYMALLHDITERRQAEDALRASEQKFRGFIEQSSEGFALIDENGKVVEWNQAQEQISGLSRTDAIGMALWDIQSEMVAPERRKPGDDERIKKIVLDIVRTGQFPPYMSGIEAEVHRPDGKRVFVQQSLFPIATQKGYRLGAIARDVTERKHSEQALRASEARFRALTENASDMILILDTEGVIQYASSSVQRVMGYAPEGLIGQSVFTLLHPEDAAQMRTAWPYLLEQLVTHAETTHARIRHADGTWHIHEGVGRNLLSEPAIAGLVLNTRDITEREQAEEAIRISQQRLSVLIERSPLAVIEWDLDFRVVAWNPAAEQLYGYRAEEVIGRYAVEIMAPEVVRNQIPDYSEQLEQQKHDILAQKGDQHRIVTNYTKDGRPFICEWFYTLLVDAKGDPFGVATIGMDITERKHLEAEREALIAELEVKNAELERFAYTVSHDLKSPLITIGGFTGFLEKDALSGNTERVKADITQVNDAVAKMQHLLDELLELSRIGRIMNPPEAVPFEAIAREAVEAVHGRIEAHGIQVEIALGLPVVFGDQTRLVEVVQNLVDNACKFMGEQPHPRIEIGVRESGDGPVFFVRDNGIGIDPQYHDKIFGLFDKLDPQSEGTGIGLALVKRIIEIHGGKIWIESQLEEGTTFYFTLPLPSNEWKKEI